MAGTLGGFCLRNPSKSPRGARRASVGACGASGAGFRRLLEKMAPDGAGTGDEGARGARCSHEKRARGGKGATRCCGASQRGARAPRGRAIPMKNVREVEKAPVWRRFEKKAARWRSGGGIIGNGRPWAPGERPRGTFRSARRKKMAPRGVREVEMAPGSEDRRPRTSRRRSVHTLQAALNVIGRSIGGRCVHLASERCLPDAQGRVL